MGVDPIPIDTQLGGKGRSIDIAPRALFAIRVKEVRYAVSDLLDLVGIQLHLLADAAEAHQSISD